MKRLREPTIAALDLPKLLSRFPEYAGNPAFLKFTEEYLKIFYEEALDNLIKHGNDSYDYFWGQLQLIELVLRQTQSAHENYLSELRAKERLTY